MMNDGNDFTNLFQELMEASRWVSADDNMYTETVEENERVFLFFKKKVKKVVPVQPKNLIPDTIERIMDKYEYLFPFYTEKLDQDLFVTLRKPVTFKMLWDFCDFVKLAEYVIFYTNVADNEFYVNSSSYQFGKYKEDDKKIIAIKITNSLTLYIELEIVEERYTSNSMKIIKLTVDRGYSNQKPQVIVCEDEVSDDNCDAKDSIFLSNISDIIYDQCYAVFKDIVNSIIAESGVNLK